MDIFKFGWGLWELVFESGWFLGLCLSDLVSWVIYRV